MRLIDLHDIREKGLRFSRQHFYRMIREGKFPKPLKVGSNTNAWLESEVDQYIADRVKQRNAA